MADHVDVLVIGAGISGVCAAHYLAHDLPEHSFLVVEARDRIGGTWDLFRYPGIRSDSDMYTFGFSFRPWSGPGVADGPAIRAYVEQTVKDEGLDAHIRFGVRVERVVWSSEAARWTVEARHLASGEARTFTCRFLIAGTGYYRYDQGYTPDFPGMEQFGGAIVHPQQWPEGLEVAGKRVAVIGSGATAITLVPALAEQGAHVTMIQRSPTYVIGRPQHDPNAEWLRRWLPERAAYRAIRWRNVVFGLLWYQYCRRFPDRTRKMIRDGTEAFLGGVIDVGEHFDPPYDPWDQRMCLAPDGDFFEALKARKATIVTSQVTSFTEGGVAVASGQEVPADIVVTATGLVLQFLGGADMVVDGEVVDLSKTRMYRGTMLSDVPNAAFLMGYTNASWTLKAELSMQYLTRLLAHLETKRYRSVVPRKTDPGVAELPALDLDAGYIRRALDDLPSQGSKLPWRVYQNYLLDNWLYRATAIEDGVLAFA